jgi:hypothetical protein
MCTYESNTFEGVTQQIHMPKDRDCRDFTNLNLWQVVLNAISFLRQ